MSRPDRIRIGDNVSNLNIYEIINKYFGKNYRGWGKATFSINDEYAAWFPTIYETNTRPDGNYGGTRMWSNTLSPDKKTIIEVNHDLKPGMFGTVSKNYWKKRVVFGRIDGHFRFLGVFKGSHVKDAKVFTTRYMTLKECALSIHPVLVLLVVRVIQKLQQKSQMKVTLSAML